MELININNNDRNLIIFSKDTSICDFIKQPKYEHFLLTNRAVYTIYYGHIYNPPFFNNIISLRPTNLEDVQQIWNMTLINGYLYVDDKYKNLFSNSIIKTTKNKILVKKSINLTFIFPEYRILEFIIAGTMKGGTTAAITNLSTHPDISMVEKEIHFFDDKSTYQKGLDWYKSHFNYSKKMTGDKAPDVMYQSSCLELLQLVNPQVKIILFLRNPIDRAYSHWKMTRDLFKNTSSFECCVYDEIKNRWNENKDYRLAFWHHFVQRGLYYKQIKKILKYFPKDNIHIAITENIRNSMSTEYQKIYDFLNLKPHNAEYVEEFVSKSSDVIDTKSEIYIKLLKIYEKDVKRLEKFIGYKTNWF
jgi:hypothetical protein